jgi:hypothetical protein
MGQIHLISLPFLRECHIAVVPHFSGSQKALKTGGNHGVSMPTTNFQVLWQEERGLAFNL